MAALTLSSRLSFSHDLDLSLPLPAATHHLDDTSDFDFSVSLDNISIHDPSPADHLFSHGKLLPLSSLAPAHAQAHPITHLDDLRPEKPKPNQPEPTDAQETTTQQRNALGIGRSSSVGAAATTSSSKSKLISICPPFPRSKSTGSYPSPKNQKQQQQQQRQRLAKNRSSSSKNGGGGGGYYYWGWSGSVKRSASYAAGGGVRVSPVINVPTRFIPRGGSSTSSSSRGSGEGGAGGRSVNSIFAYLLCNCGVKNGKELVCGGEI